MVSLLTRTLLLFALLCTGLPGCNIDTQPLPGLTGDEMGDAQDEEQEDPPANDATGGANAPVPSESFRFDASQVFHSPDSDTTRLVVGLPNTFTGTADELEVVNLSRTQPTMSRRALADDGSFAVFVEADVGDELELALFTVDMAPTLIATFVFTLQEPGDVVLRASEFASTDVAPDNMFVSPPDSTGVAVVSLPGNIAVADQAFVAANVTFGNSVLGVTDSAGTLRVSIAATRGDKIRLFAVDPSASNGGGASVNGVVP